MSKLLLALGYAFIPVIPVFAAWFIWTLFLLIFKGLDKILISLISLLYVSVPAATTIYIISFILLLILGTQGHACRWLTIASSVIAVITFFIFIGFNMNGQTGSWN